MSLLLFIIVLEIQIKKSRKEKINKRHPDFKGSIKILFPDDMIIYT